MKWFALVLGLASAQAFAGASYRFHERVLPVDTSAYDAASLALLSSGNFAACLNTADGSRVYTVTRTGTILGLRYFPNIFISQMRPVGNDVLVAGWQRGAQENTYAARLDSTVNFRWQTVLDGSSIGRPDFGQDLALDNAGNLFIAGGVEGMTGYYAFCLSLKVSDGSLRFRTARATMDNAYLIEATNNGKVHVFSRGKYWRLTSANGTTEAIVNQPAGVYATVSASKGTDVYVAGRLTDANGPVPYIQKRSNAGALLWGQVDWFNGTNRGSEDDNRTLDLQLDNSGYPVMNCLVSTPSNGWSHIIRWNPSGFSQADSWFSRQGGELGSGPLAIDAYNAIYSGQEFRKTSGSQLSLYKFQVNVVTTDFSNFLASSSGLSDPGVHFATLVHPGSGDIISLHRDNALPSQTAWQIWRQQAIPVADTFAVSGATYNSPTSVLANDRFKENAALELVATTTKGTLNLNTTTGFFTYMKNPGATGTDKFTYRLRKNNLVGVATTVTLGL